MYRYRVKENKPLSETTQLVTLEHSGKGPLIAFQPGQYAAIGFRSGQRHTVVRCFSITSSPNNPSQIQFCLRVKGKFTNFVRRLQPGQIVFVRGPFGAFVFDPQYDTNMVLMAGGIGIAPFMSMIRYATERQLDNKIHLIYSARSQDDIAFYDVLRELAQHNKNLQLSYLIGQGETDRISGNTVLSGQLDSDTLDELNLSYGESTFFLCGPPGYMKAVSKLLQSHGVDKHRIITEAFSQGPNDQTGALRSWPYNIYGMSAFAVVFGGIAVMALDLAKTLPDLDQSSLMDTSPSNGSISLDGSDPTTAVQSLPPQVDTNISQGTVQQTATTPTTTQPVTTTPTPTPAPSTSTTPTPLPRSTVS